MIPLKNSFLGQPATPEELDDQLRQAKVEALRDAAKPIFSGNEYDKIIRMADEIERSKT